MLPREDISFQRFLSDLRLATGAKEPLTELPRADEDEDPLDLPPVRLRLRSGSLLEYPGEELEELWQMLRTRGAVPMAHFPGVAREHAPPLLNALLKLDYIQPVQFALGPQYPTDGVRFFPKIAHGTTNGDVDLTAEP